MTAVPCERCGRGCGGTCEMHGTARIIADDRAAVENATRHAAASADPTTGAKLERLLARNALTSLGRSHPANMSRAERRSRGWRGTLDDAVRELKRQAHEADQ